MSASLFFENVPGNAMKDDKIAALRKTKLFERLSEQVLQKAARYATVRHVQPGQVVFSESEEAHGLYVIAEGELRSIRQNAEGREQVLSTERAGAILAVAPLFNSGKFYSTMIADTAASIVCLEKRHIEDLCREHPELLWSLARILAHRVRHYSELVETLAFKNVEQRLAQHLLAVARERGVRVGEGCVVELKLTRAEIASRLGTTREVVSRSFAHLQKSGLIQMDGRRLVTVPNMRALSAFAGTEREGSLSEPVSELPSDIA